MSYASNMNIEEINPTRRKMNISVAASAVQDAVQTTANEMQKTAEIRGFRKGKAPLNMVRKFYMNDIVKKAADKIINDAYKNSIKEIDFQIVSHPHIEPENQFSEESEFKFSATVDINPKLDMVDYKNLSIKLPSHLKSSIDEQYEKLIQSYQKAFGKTQTIEEDHSLEKNDYLKMSYSVYHEGEELLSKKAVNQLIGLDNSNFPEIEEALLGMKKGDSKVVAVQIPDTYRDTELQGKKVEFHIHIDSIEKMLESSLDDDFAKRLGYDNMETAKSKIRETLEQTHQEMRVNAAFEQIVDQVLTKNDFEVAESLIESTIDRVIQEKNHAAKGENQINGDNQEQRNQFREMALKNIRGILALGHIARQEGVTVSDDEMYRDLSNYAISNRIDPRQLLKNGTQILDEFRGQAMIRKVVDKLLNYAQIEYTDGEEKLISAVE